MGTTADATGPDDEPVTVTFFQERFGRRGSLVIGLRARFLASFCRSTCAAGVATVTPDSKNVASEPEKCQSRRPAWL